MKKLYRCYECNAHLNNENRGKWSPEYFCKKCDKERIARIDRQFADIAKKLDLNSKGLTNKE